MNRAAVIVNEFGEVGIDHELVAASSERRHPALDNGCLCCVVRTDLQETLRDAVRAAPRGRGDRLRPRAHRDQRARRSGAGDADARDRHDARRAVPARRRRDAGRRGERARPARPRGGGGEAGRARRPAAGHQDRPARTPRRCASGCTTLNPRAELADVVQGEIDPAFLTGIGLTSARADAAQIGRWLGAGSGEGAYLGAVAPRHDPSITTFTLWFDRPFDWQTFSSALELLTSLRGPDLLRVKGLVNVEGEAGPVVVQGVQHVFHPPVTLAAWPSDDRRSRLVFITRGIEEPAVSALFAAVGMVQGGRSSIDRLAGAT